MAEHSHNTQGNAGGYISHPLLSPPHSTTTASSPGGPLLPHPRASPLKQGTAMADNVYRYIEKSLARVERRFITRTVPRTAETIGEPGYKSMDEICNDLGDVVDVLWKTGTPSLQVPFLFNVAHALTEYLPHFPPAPLQSLALLYKLDYAFASMLAGRDLETGEALPGFSTGKTQLSQTDMVRLKSLAEQTRILFVDVLSRPAKQEGDEEQQDGDIEDQRKTDTEQSGDEEFPGWDDEDEDEQMEVAKVYEQTLTRLDEALSKGTAYSIGMIAD